MTTAYCPQANGMVERSHRQLKDSWRSRAAGADWPSHLPWVLLGLRAAPKDESGISSAELVLGSPLTLPGQFLSSPEPPPADFVQQLQRAPSPPPTRPLTYAEAVAVPSPALSMADYVYIRRGGTIPPLRRCTAAPTGWSGQGRSISQWRSAARWTPFQWTASNLTWASPLLCQPRLRPP